MLVLPAATALLSMLLAPNNGTAAITFRVSGHVVEATLRAPRRAFANLPQRAPAAVVAGSCAVRADNIALQPGTMTVDDRASSDSLVTAVVRYRTATTPKTLDVSCAMFPATTASTPHPSLVVVLAGTGGRTALISANADGRVDAGMRLTW